MSSDEKSLRWLIFSDTHLTSSFYPEKYEMLSDAISRADRVIINGDFIDCLMEDPYETAKSEWSQLFTQLLQKDAIFIHGNHDPESLLPMAVAEQFSAVQERWWRFASGEQEFFITHGDLIAPTQESWIPSERLTRRIARFGRWLQHSLLRWHYTEYVYRFLWSKPINSRLSHWSRDQFENGQTLICGHSHGQVRRPQRHFIDTGAVDEHRFELAFVQGGKVELVQRRY